MAAKKSTKAKAAKAAPAPTTVRAKAAPVAPKATSVAKRKG